MLLNKMPGLWHSQTWPMRSSADLVAQGVHQRRHKHGVSLSNGHQGLTAPAGLPEIARLTRQRGALSIGQLWHHRWKSPQRSAMAAIERELLALAAALPSDATAGSDSTGVSAG